MNTPKLTKSWIITLIAFACTVILPLANDTLEDYNIIITENELDHYVTLLLVSAGFGTAASVRKQLKEGKTSFSGLTKLITKAGTKIPKSTPSEKITIVNNKTEKLLSTPPTLGPATSYYQTNFRQDKKLGNVLDFGQSYLWIKMIGVRSYVSVKLKTADGFPIQIDQSSEFDEDNNIETTRLEMFVKSGAPLPKGKYILESRGDRGSSDSIGIKNDPFEIV